MPKPVDPDLLEALLFEYRSYAQNGLDDRAEDVAKVLAIYGHDPRPVKSEKPAPEPKERAVADEPLEKVVEEAPAPKRRGRPPKGE
ncbi:hypothetical protein SEA_JUICYJAY_26 [Mycobacterium phage JuicyJay]|uniref:Uncharacterized protein n=1 Tax=Mycobacterium phage Duke13 TaxID=2499038 RepID=A0A3S9UAN9_9CAUD|nr:head-tail connector protein [Mycobacterium phage Minerva]AXF51509.1 hypothetical protein CONSTELLA_19 [Mycobacterium phage Constella]AXQ62432.1 hypothetical protein SEA_ZELINK_25 [Mycobacterium phage Zelink]AZS07365.1 hypothetical protein PBI_DUKE13_21 [Mycobacterium phage Duke13]UEM46515.1 hypothetical protein SEA_JUICYJAY_26 [Mycobacterium phage JuicyJay]AIK69233.1 hypothetical protein PBI_MINERVA_24 [Mycobacterium phage Minerva]